MSDNQGWNEVPFWHEPRQHISLVDELQRQPDPPGHRSALPMPIGSPRSRAVPSPSMMARPPPPSNRQQASPPYRLPWQRADGPTEADRKLAAAREARSIDGRAPLISDVDLALHCEGADTLYMAIDGHVYDVTNYVNKHPGGFLMMTRNAGKDVTAVFNRIGHSHRARDLLADMYVGDLVRTEQSDASGAKPPQIALGSDVSSVVVTTARSLAPPPSIEPSEVDPRR